MRIPLRHRPPEQEPAKASCAHLEVLAEASVGLPLGPAARALARGRGRGRHGNALQWHFGLDMHDSQPQLDWEDRIEIKLVSCWTQQDGGYACDKLKVCEIGMNPWDKLANVLWVFADRVSRVVLGWRTTHLAGELRASLARSWSMDPHFDGPPLFVESRDSAEGSAPAYYLAARWFADAALLPSNPEGIGFPFDGKLWGELRKAGGGRDPLLTVVEPDQTAMACPRCNAALQVDRDRLLAQGIAVARHLMPLAGDCAVRGHLCLRSDRLPRPIACSPGELVAGVESRTPADRLWRLADRVPEPDDHLH